MAKGSSSSVLPPETFTVFVDTSLGTHLVMAVSPEDTVGDLKGKISNEHAVCFPSIGDITVQSMKVRRKGSFYHLSESMLVRSAFDGIKRTWFLHIDVSICHQAGTTEHVTNQDAGQSHNHRLLDTEPNATDFGSGEVRLQFVNFSSDGKDLISTDMNSVHEKQTLPETYRQMVSVNNKFSLPHAGISNDNFDYEVANVGVSTHTNLSTKGMHDDRCMFPHDPEKRSDADLPELLEPVCEGNVAVGSDLEPKTNQMLDQGEDGRERDHCNVGVEANDGFVSIKKHKSRKRSNVSRTDPLLEKDGSFVEKKKHKREHDDPSEDPLAKENNPVSAEKLCSTPHHDDCSPKNLTSNEKEKEKKKKNRKKKGASKFDSDNASAIPKTGTSDASLEKTGAVVSDAALFIDKSTRSVDDGDSVEDLVNIESVEDPSGNIRRDLIKESDAAATIGEPVGHRNPAWDSEVPSKSNVRSSHRSRRGKSDKTEISQVNSKEAPDYQHRDPDKESKFGEAVVLENAAIEDSAVPSAPKETSSRHKRKKSSKAELTNHGSLDKEPVRSIMKGTTGENPLETLEDIHKQQGKESKWETFLGEGAPLESPADVNLAIPSNTIDRSSHHHKRKKVKAKVSCTSINHELDESKGRTTHDETAQNLAPGNHIDAKSTGLPNDSSKKHDIAHHSIIKEAMADLAASSESTEENTPYKSKRYRVAVRKVPSKRFGKNMNNTGQEKTLLPTSGTIFSDALSGSSEDEFEIDNKKATSKVLSDNSSTSDDSDGDLEETQMSSLVKPRACMYSPGVDSVVYGKNDDGIDDIIMTQPSSVAKKSMLLDTILRSTSRYRKAKPTASQSELEDRESQPVEGVLETQPDSL